MSEEKEVVVVAISEFSWNILIEKNFYAFPKGKRKIGKYYAFYKDGKITNYAKVKSIKEGGKNEVSMNYWLYCMPEAEPPYQIVTFERIIKLNNEILRNKIRGGHVQGARYTTLNKLLKAKQISDLR
jgi:hypothetical protein